MDLEKIIEAAGGEASLAKSMNLVPGAVYNWLSRNKVPASRAHELSKISGVPLHEIRPDLWLAPDEAEI